MATEEQKKIQLLRVFSMMALALAKNIYDALGETSYAMMRGVGIELLEILQKEMGLEIQGEEPEDVLNELMRIWVDEIGFIEESDVKKTDTGWTVTGHHCKSWALCQKILETGAKEPFTCPIMSTMRAALEKMGVRTHINIEPQSKTRGTQFILTNV